MKRLGAKFDDPRRLELGRISTNRSCSAKSFTRASTPAGLETGSLTSSPSSTDTRYTTAARLHQSFEQSVVYRPRLTSSSGVESQALAQIRDPRR